MCKYLLVISLLLHVFIDTANSLSNKLNMLFS